MAKGGTQGVPTRSCVGLVTQSKALSAFNLLQTQDLAPVSRHLTHRDTPPSQIEAKLLIFKGLAGVSHPCVTPRRVRNPLEKGSYP